jgi:hypothetical protein
MALFSNVNVYNTASSGTLLYEFYSGGNYYRGYLKTITATSNTNSGGVWDSGYAFLLNAGERIYVTPSATGMYIASKVVEFDVVPEFKRPTLLSLASGDNILYECPVGKKANQTTSNFLLGCFNLISSSSQVGFYSNDSGNTREIKLYYKPSGGSAVQIFPTATVADNGIAIFLQAPLTNLVAGDQIIINTNSANATQWAALMPLMELPA